jgi:hypothetical protein
MHQIGANEVWKSMAAGLCGNAAHGPVIFLKRWMGWLPTFHRGHRLLHAARRAGPSVVNERLTLPLELKPHPNWIFQCLG